MLISPFHMDDLLSQHWNSPVKPIGRRILNNLLTRHAVNVGNLLQQEMMTTTRISGFKRKLDLAVGLDTASKKSLHIQQQYTPECQLLGYCLQALMESPSKYQGAHKKDAGLERHAGLLLLL